MTADELIKNADNMLKGLYANAYIYPDKVTDLFCFVMNTIDYDNVRRELCLEIECDKLFGIDLIRDGRCPKDHLYLMLKEKLNG